MKKYLTKEKKEYYQTELMKAVDCTDPDWDLDEGLKDILFKINDSPNLQTILSKRANKPNHKDFNSCHSYLHLAVTKEAENKLIKIAGEMLNKFTDKSDNHIHCITLYISIFLVLICPN